ncbi:MAG: hypothetical protein WAU88_05240 [Candidatus Zixiibacteriota bacterium]
MKYELRRIPVFPVIKVTFLVSLVLGFAVGLLAAMFIVPLVAMMSRLGSAGDGMPSSDIPFGVLAIFLPILYAVLLAVMNSLMVLVATGAYNVIVRFAGGIELELESTDQGLPAPQQPVQPVYYAQAAPPPYAVPPSRPAPPPPPPPPPVPPNNPEADKNRPTQFPFE